MADRSNDESVPIIAMAPKNTLYNKMVSNIQEVAARGGQLIIFSDTPEAASSVKAYCTSTCRKRTRWSFRSSTRSQFS